MIRYNFLGFCADFLRKKFQLISFLVKASVSNIYFNKFLFFISISF